MPINLQQAIESFDIEAYLNEIVVEYRDSGKNIGVGSIGICCPLCGDDNYHMGINLEKKFYNCWRCGDYDINGRGSLFNLIYILEGLDSKAAYRRIVNYSEVTEEQEMCVYEALQTINTRWEIKPEPVIESPQRKLKVNVSGKWKSLKDLNSEFFAEQTFLNYVNFRRFTIDELIHWGARAYFSDKFVMRLVFPVYQDREVVNYVGRDVTGKAQTKYLNCSNDDAIVSMKELLFGLQWFTPNPDYVILVEGIFDVMRVGSGMAIASLGLILTDTQKGLLYKLNPKKLFIMFDPEAWVQAEKIKAELGVFINDIEVVRLPLGKDPADMEQNQLLEIYQEYNIKERGRCDWV